MAIALVVEIRDTKRNIIIDLIDIIVDSIKNGIFFEEAMYILFPVAYYMLFYRSCFIFTTDDGWYDGDEIKKWVIDNMSWPYKIVNTVNKQKDKEFVVFIFREADYVAFKLRWV